MADPGLAELLLGADRQDLLACEALSNAPGIGDAIVELHAQQCVEKSIKSYKHQRPHIGGRWCQDGVRNASGS